MKTVNFIRKVVALFCLFLAVNIMPGDAQDGLIDAVVPWLDRENKKVLETRAKRQGQQRIEIDA